MLPVESPINPACTRTWMRWSLAVVLLLALAWGVAPTELRADTHTVTTTADSGAGSLRQAIADAASGDTITFALSYPATITLTSAELVIDKSLTIEGPGEAQLTISGNYARRVFMIHAGGGDTVTLSDLTVARGRNTSDSEGGCMLIFGGLAATLDHVTVRDCMVTSGWGMGGAIDSVDGSLTLTYSSVISNQAVLGAGIFLSGGGSTLTLVHSAVLSNTSGPPVQADDGEGGGIYIQYGSATLDHSRVEANRVTGGWGGALDDSRGGGISVQGNLTIDSSDIRNNQAGAYGGGISSSEYASVVAITGTVIVGNLTNGSNAEQHGGGLYLIADAAITNTWISTNTASFGGGIYVGGTVTIANSTLQYNTVTGWVNGVEARGGGIFASGSTDVYVTNSTISNNRAEGSGGGISEDCASGYDCSDHEVSLVNATVSGNVADGDLDADGGDGGGIYRVPAVGQQIKLKNTIVAANDDLSTPGADDCAGTITSQGYNLVGNATGCPHGQTGDIAAADPLLGPLNYNGGATPTHALLSGSPAIDHIPAGINGCGTSVTTDQRYMPRPMGLGCDIGAFEAEPPPQSVTGLVVTGPALSGLVGSFYTFTATVSPITASTPITYVWVASGGTTPGTPLTRVQAANRDVIALRWSITGTQLVTVTARNRYNAGGPLTNTITFNISDMPISGLQASNDGPKQVGQSCTLTASIASGSSVGYAWNFGDGSSGAGVVVTHVFTAAGRYTASVVASNPVGQQAADTVVIIGDGVAEADPALADSWDFHTVEPGGGPPLTTTLELPAGAITETLSIVFQEVSTSTHPAPGSLTFAGRMFSLQAYHGDQLREGLHFSPPITLSLAYTAQDVAGLDEANLELRFWDPTAQSWSSDGIVVVERDTFNHRLVVTISHLTEFGLFGSQQVWLFLPMVVH